jgi:hypothetical protein
MINDGRVGQKGLGNEQYTRGGEMKGRLNVVGRAQGKRDIQLCGDNGEHSKSVSG